MTLAEDWRSAGTNIVLKMIDSKLHPITHS